jgi:hypothetical protein
MSGIRSEPTPDPSLVREGRIKAPSPDKGRDGEGFGGFVVGENQQQPDRFSSDPRYLMSGKGICGSLP